MEPSFEFICDDRSVELDRAGWRVVRALIAGPDMGRLRSGMPGRQNLAGGTRDGAPDLVATTFSEAASLASILLQPDAAGTGTESNRLGAALFHGRARGEVGVGCV